MFGTICTFREAQKSITHVIDLKEHNAEKCKMLKFQSVALEK